MTYAKANSAGWLIAGAILIAGVGATAVACSSQLGSEMADSAGRGSGDPKPGEGNSPDFSSSSSGGSSGATNAAAGAPTGSGIILVHAASFPSFRVCFEKSPQLAPQPDSKIMPEANVVGVEVGSVVRIDPVGPPGKIYVINEKAIRTLPGNPDELSCGDLLGTGTQSLDEDNDYHTINTPIEQPLGDGKVHVLAITGCGSQAFLNLVSGPNADNKHCGPSWNTTSGNLRAEYVELSTTKTGASASTVPVQLVHVAPDVAAKGGSLEVSFGPLAAGTNKLGTEVAAKTLFLAQGPQVTLQVDQTNESVYGAQGFRIVLRDGNGTATFATDQSLASVQALSSPTDLPTTYYRAASNYALLLLGDPNASATLDGGGPNRRAVHLLAVPVVDPTTLDGGAADGGGGGPVTPVDGGAK